MSKILLAVLVLGFAFLAVDSAAQQGSTGPTFPADRSGSAGTPALPPVVAPPSLAPPPNVAVAPDVTGRAGNPVEAPPISTPPANAGETR